MMVYIWVVTQKAGAAGEPFGRHVQARPVQIGFMMDQVAGHVTNYQNLRFVADQDPAIEAAWCEIHYYRVGGRIETVRERYLPFIPSYFSGTARGAIELRRALRGTTADALFSNAAVGVFFTRQFRATPTMLDFDSTPLQLDLMPSYTSTPDLPAVASLKFRLTQRQFRSAAILQAWSNWAAESVVRDYGVDPARVIVNPPGVDSEHWSKARRHRSGAARRILFVGADFDRKGGFDLLNWVTSTDVDVELDIVTRDPLPSQPRVNVHLGLTPNSPELLKLYRSADLFVLPSKGECFGISTIEAMSAGLPVVTSDVGGTADIVEVGGNGFIVPAESPLKLAAAIEAIIGDEQRRLAMGQRSIQLAEAKFDLRRNARVTLDHLVRIATERHISLSQR